ncbi:hypothetical protein KO528_14990 [Saccharophagus degradans]|uniref:hypothetical protein n=1 Tax=Saccharophagus degradans TaxID=86304 RepID=UPI001C08C8E4|nr:hypothetical protein [Saccharophagus degradans]MBU2986668.1 hypothetical protein [Saccharophagus degradans]
MKVALITTLICLATFSASYAENNTEVGVSLGTPGAINLVVKKDMWGLPLQISGGAMENILGVEIGYRFYVNNDNIFRSAQLVTGYTSVTNTYQTIRLQGNNYVLADYDEKKSWSYIGVSNTFQFGGFFIEPGLNIGTGEYTSPQLLIQAGWLWSF